MRNYELSFFPWECCMTEAVEMNNVGRKSVFQVQQPLTGLRDIVPSIVHPFQPVLALEKIEVRNRTRFFILRRLQRRSHDCKVNLDAVLFKSACQLQRVGPNTTNVVSGHQNSFYWTA